GIIRGFFIAVSAYRADVAVGSISKSTPLRETFASRSRVKKRPRRRDGSRSRKEVRPPRWRRVKFRCAAPSCGDPDPLALESAFLRLRNDRHSSRNDHFGLCDSGTDKAYLCADRWRRTWSSLTKASHGMSSIRHFVRCIFWPRLCDRPPAAVL